ncbi:MAG: two-component regulator propeller domain-containing protein [Chloracidobacterium sp.]|uniref:Carboxypeptidase regulatory-like domain-containing protein n=1 Tax=Chloracidobacterium validum TaxID=2821543 RepID=A0ABX8B9N9_9BACT|nr:two-component regulator propeller domain-containing protein [Chloracidobacterium validum]QUW02270.1 carboxypeptidase regulatory-like domain-containing protein [Chloracidobacterium validum]
MQLYFAVGKPEQYKLSSVSGRGRTVGWFIGGWLMLWLAALGGKLIAQSPTTPGLTISGLVVSETGAPMADAKVTCAGPNFPTASLLTTGDGRFAFSIPRTGKYVLTATVSGYRPQTQAVTLNRPDEAVGDIKLQLSPSSLRVAVRDGRTSTVMSGAIVTARLKERREVSALRALEGRRGEYFFGRMEAGTYEVTAVVTGYEAKTVETVITGERTTMELTLLLSRVSTIPLGVRSLDRSFVTPRLPSNQVQTVFADRDGSVWFGTSAGVCRFDGQAFWSSETPESKLSRLAGRSVTALARAADGTLWFGTSSGLAALPPDATAVVFRDESIPNVRCLLPGTGGELWVGAESGLYRYSPSAPHSAWMAEIGTTPVTALQALPGGGLAVASGLGLFWWQPGQAWERLPWLTQPTTEAVYGIAADPYEPTLWCATATGLWMAPPGGPLTAVSGALLQQPLRACCVDSEGRVWCARADGRGVLVYDPRRNETAELLTDTDVTSVTCDLEQNIWFATRNGALRHDAYSFVVFDTSRGLPDSDVYAIAPRADGRGLWVGTARGVYAFDGIQFQSLRPELSTLAVRALLATDQRLWVGAEQGLWLWDGSSVRPVSAGDRPFAQVRSLLLDATRQTLWVATAKALFKLDPETLKLDSEAIPLDGEVRMAMLSRSGAVWLATSEGAYRYEPSTAELVVIGATLGLESLDVRAIVEQPRAGRFWLATGRGIETFDGVGFVPDGFRAAVQGGDVQSLYVEPDPLESFLWVGLRDGNLRKFLLDNETVVQTYRRDHYDLGGPRLRMMVETQDGVIWMATDAGLVRHRPNPRPPTVDIRLEVDGAEADALDVAGTEATGKKVSLRAGFHRLKFRFAAVSQAGPITYFYRIAGRDADWRQVSPDSAVTVPVEYAVSGLPAGEHVFEVRALSRDLYGRHAPVQRYIVWIDPPFYLRGWFWAVCVLVMTGGGTGAWFVQRARSREYVLPPALRKFTPIGRNPYVVGNPIRSQAMFFGREDDFQYVARKLEGTPQGLVIVFCGERRTGKSSILYQIANGRLGEAFAPVFIDMQEMLVRSDGEFFNRVARLITEALARLPLDPLPESGQDFTAESGGHSGNPYDRFRDFIGAALRHIGNRQMVWLVDEYELFETKVEDGKLSRDLLPFLASLLDRHERLSFVFTGSRRLEDRDRRFWRDLLRRSLFRKVSYLTPNDTRRLITDPVKDCVVYGRGVVDAIVRLTAGQPFYTQVLCQNIVDLLNEQERHYVLRADVLTIVEEVVNNPLPQMMYFWDGLSDDEKLVLALAADTLIDENDVITAGRLVARIAESNYPVTLSETTIRLTLEELFRNEVLEKHGDETFAYRVDLLRYWIRRRHSVWQVIGEVRSR